MLRTTMLAITLLLACITIARTDIPSCTIPNNVFPGIQPLLLQRDASDQITFLYPNNNNGMITIPPGKAVYLVCPGKTNKFTNNIFGSTNELMAVCKRNTIFLVDEKEVAITSLTCQDHGEQVGKYINRLSCRPCPKSRLPYKHANIKPVEIGFHTSMGFIGTIELCFDTMYRQTLSTYMKMSKMIGTVHNTDVRLSVFRKGIFYGGIDTKNAYSFDVQMNVMSEILGKQSLAQELLKKDGRYKQYLTRGHLVAKSDFVYVEQQRSTFWYVNTAPQWKTFNEGNWNLLEKSVREFVRNRRLNLEVYTGTDDIMTIEDAKGNPQPIYLQDPVTNNRMYVPRFFWKIIYDPQSKRGTAFVGVNDPFMKRIADDVYLCNDTISKSITWLRWREPQNIKAGISYACKIEELREVIWLPELDVKDILM